MFDTGLEKQAGYSHKEKKGGFSGRDETVMGKTYILVLSQYPLTCFPSSPPSQEDKLLGGWLAKVTGQETAKNETLKNFPS